MNVEPAQKGVEVKKHRDYGTNPEEPIQKKMCHQNRDKTIIEQVLTRFEGHYDPMERYEELE
mgnify:CR=1 FL=1